MPAILCCKVRKLTAATLITVTWMPTVRAITLLSLALAASSSCGRTEEPESAPRREPTARTAPAPTPQKSVAEPRRCLVETPATPPPTAGKAANCPKDPDADFDLPKGSVTFVDAAGTPRISVELALQDDHRSRGLMYRTAMSDEAGMLFSWPDERVRSFWMKNTCIPLDMLFIARDGTIVGILEQVPTLNQAPRSIPCPAAHVLEVNAGWTRTRGVRAGQKVKIDDA